MKRRNVRYRQWVRYLYQRLALPAGKGSRHLTVPRAWLRFSGPGFQGKDRVRDRVYLMRRGASS